MAEYGKDKQSIVKSPGTLVIEAWAKNQDQVLEDLLRDHPALTREEAIEHLTDAGFY